MLYSLRSQVYIAESNAFIFLVKEHATGLILAYSSLELFANKIIYEKLTVNQRSRVAYIAGYQQAQYEEQKQKAFNNKRVDLIHMSDFYKTLTNLIS